MKTKFIKALGILIDEGDFKDDISFQDRIFLNETKATKEINKILKSEKYPFLIFNNWVSAYIKAVDAEIDGENSSLLWKKVDNEFSKLTKNKYYQSLKPRITTPNCWVKYENSKYSIAENFDDASWAAILRRAKRKSGNFYNFKLTALNSLIKESL
ncbi:MAG: hypothetical protein H6611_10350 [Ignavibacteriales bacterium]|nr:hypothetical protein [Ignavibacteriales bacterium]